MAFALHPPPPPQQQQEAQRWGVPPHLTPLHAQSGLRISSLSTDFPGTEAFFKSHSFCMPCLSQVCSKHIVLPGILLHDLLVPALPLTHPWDGHRHHQCNPSILWQEQRCICLGSSSEVYFLVFYSKRSRCKPASGKLAAQKIPAQGLAKLKPTARSAFLMRGVRWFQ